MKEMAPARTFANSLKTLGWIPSGFMHLWTFSWYSWPLTISESTKEQSLAHTGGAPTWGTRQLSKEQRPNGTWGFHSAFAGLLSISCHPVMWQQTLRKFDQFQMYKKTTPETHKLTRQYGRKGKAGKGAEQVEDISMLMEWNHLVDSFVLKQYYSIQNSRGLSLGRWWEGIEELSRIKVKQLFKNSQEYYNN